MRILTGNSTSFEYGFDDGESRRHRGFEDRETTDPFEILEKREFAEKARKCSNLIKKISEKGYIQRSQANKKVLLSWNEAAAIYWRHVKEETLEDAGKKMGYTKERVRQMENKALDKLRNAAEQGNLEEILLMSAS